MKILKTENEIKRDERNSLIIEKFIALKEEYPTSKLNRIFIALSKDADLKSKYRHITAQTIRTVCKNAGVC